jgi:hypothetical protein
MAYYFLSKEFSSKNFFEEFFYFFVFFLTGWSSWVSLRWEESFYCLGIKRIGLLYI